MPIQVDPAMSGGAKTERPSLRLILSSFAFILVLSIVLIGGLTVVAVRGQNQTAIKDSVHLLRSITSDIDRRLADQLLDYSYWNEAVENLVTKPDLTWADKNIGIYMYENFNIASSFVLDANNRLVYAMVNGKRREINPLNIFSGGLKDLLDRTRAWPLTEPPISASGFLSDGKTVQIVSVSVLTNFKKEDAPNKTIASGSVLIFTKAIDSKYLEDISENYLLDDLRFVPVGSIYSSAFMQLDAVDNSTLGYLTWNVKSPAGEMMQWLLPLIGFVLIIFAVTANVFFRKTQAIVNTLENNIVEIKAAQEALSESENRFKDFAEIASDWFWETDEDHRFSFFSGRNFNVTGHDSKAIIGKRRQELTGEDTSEKKWLDHLADLNAHRPFYNFQYEIKNPDGVPLSISINGKPAFDEKRAFTGYRGTGTDVTELKNAEQALRKSEERYRFFAADAAHELRTPLTVLRSNLDQLEDEDAVSSLRQDVDSMARMVEQLLTYSRLDNLISDSFTVADIKKVCISIAAYLGPLAVNEKRSIEVIAPEGPVLAHGNEDAISHAVRNLVENAIRYSARGKTVTIQVDDEPSIRVIDHGCGVAPDKKKEIFKRFRRSDRRAGGAGLGLSIVQRVVEAHRGTIEIQDTANGGATFIIHLPKITHVIHDEQDIDPEMTSIQ